MPDAAMAPYRRRRSRRQVFDLTRAGQEHDDVLPPANDRGRLVYDFQIVDEFFGGLPGIDRKVRWVRDHLPRASRIKIGNASAWFEEDVKAYLATLGRESSP